MYSCDLDLWPFHVKSKRRFPRFMWSMCTKFQDRCKGNTVMRWRPCLVINAMWPCQWSLCDSMCKEMAVMGKTMHCDLDLWTLKSIGYILGSWGGCMRRSVTVGLKGKQILAINRNADERQTDTLIPVYPQNFVEGYNYEQEN